MIILHRVLKPRLIAVFIGVVAFILTPVLGLFGFDLKDVIARRWSIGARQFRC